MPESSKAPDLADEIGATDAAGLLDVNPLTVYRMAQRGELKVRVIAGRKIFSRRAVTKLAEKRRAAAAALVGNAQSA